MSSERRRMESLVRIGMPIQIAICHCPPGEKTKMSRIFHAESQGFKQFNATQAVQYSCCPSIASWTCSNCCDHLLPAQQLERQSVSKLNIRGMVQQLVKELSINQKLKNKWKHTATMIHTSIVTCKLQIHTWKTQSRSAAKPLATSRVAEPGGRGSQYLS